MSRSTTITGSAVAGMEFETDAETINGQNFVYSKSMALDRQGNPTDQPLDQDYPARRASGMGNWDPPRHTTCSGRPLSRNPTYSAFWSGFGATCLRWQRLASSVGFGTTSR
jgi:hypothetical protein